MVCAIIPADQCYSDYKIALGCEEKSAYIIAVMVRVDYYSTVEA